MNGPEAADHEGNPDMFILKSGKQRLLHIEPRCNSVGDAWKACIRLTRLGGKRCQLSKDEIERWSMPPAKGGYVKTTGGGSEPGGDSMVRRDAQKNEMVVSG